jgi:hypothetical protein
MAKPYNSYEKRDIIFNCNIHTNLFGDVVYFYDI